MVSKEVKTLRRDLHDTVHVMLSCLPEKPYRGPFKFQDYRWRSDVLPVRANDSLGGPSEWLSANAYLSHYFRRHGRFISEHMVNLSFEYDPDRTFMPDLELFGVTWLPINYATGKIEAVVRGLEPKDMYYSWQPPFQPKEAFRPIPDDYYFAIDQLRAVLPQ